MKPVGQQARECDVLIVGAGQAGGCLARQLRLEQPDLKIIVVDRNESFNWWVGESTVEPFDDYAIRALKLGPYLARHHMAKHGLRFFWDSKEKDLSITEMSELGRSRYVGLMPAYQLDRSQFDADLCKMNEAMGVEVLLGTRVLGRADELDESIKIDRTKGHVVQTSAGPITCRWLVDAAGRSSPLCQKFDLIRPDSSANTSSYWMRLKGFKNLDHAEAPKWHQRVGYTQRYLSTNHFMYDGYWFWHIPVSDEIVSLGLTFDRAKVPASFKNAEELLAFTRKHKALGELFGEGTEVLDFMALKQLARCAKTFFHEDRWFLTGMSAMFVDPLLSINSAIIAQSNRFIAELIRVDRMGDQKKLAALRRHCNLMMTRRFDVLVDNLLNFHRHGTYDAFMPFVAALNANMANFALPIYTADFKPFFDAVAMHEDNCGCEQRPGAIANDMALSRLCDEFIAFLDARGKYYEGNKGQFTEGNMRPQVWAGAYAGEMFDKKLQKMNGIQTIEAVVRYYVRRMCELDGIGFNEAAFRSAFDPNMATTLTLEKVFGAVKAAPPAPPEAKVDDLVWTPKGPFERHVAQEMPWYVQTGAGKA
jgi:FADH2 O2-dependent halogenase